MIGKMTTALASRNINIIGMVNKSRGDYACNIIDIVGQLKEEELKELEEHYGILRVMLIKQRAEK
jgi:D-3-phosphoglycerate dehydrogenase